MNWQTAPAARAALGPRGKADGAGSRHRRIDLVWRCKIAVASNDAMAVIGAALRLYFMRASDSA